MATGHRLEALHIAESIAIAPPPKLTEYWLVQEDCFVSDYFGPGWSKPPGVVVSLPRHIELRIAL